MIKKTNFAQTIKSFEDPRKGLKYLKEQIVSGMKIPDFIFLDIKMPHLNGWEFLDAYSQIEPIRQSNPHIVMMSAVDETEDREKAKANKLVICFLHKPITDESLTGLEK